MLAIEIITNGTERQDQWDSQETPLAVAGGNPKPQPSVVAQKRYNFRDHSMGN